MKSGSTNPLEPSEPIQACTEIVVPFDSQFGCDDDSSSNIINAIIVDFSKAFDLVPHCRLLTKISNSGVDSKVEVWIRKFLLGRTQRVRVR